MDKYTFLDKIGRGTHGTVYLLQHGNSTVVCKSISPKHTKYALRELNILQNISHKRIIKLIESLLIEKTHYLILEHANHGTLENIISLHKKNNANLNIDINYQKIIWTVLSQIADALFYIHSKKIIHRDIKPSNILVNQYFLGREEVLEFKLCDFSLSTATNTNTGNIVGTPFYMAPEIIKKELYDERVDIWSLGVVIYEMVVLKRPFNGKTRKELQCDILNKQIDSIDNLQRECLLCEIILRCLEKNRDRISSGELRRMDRVRYNVALGEIRSREKRIWELEGKLREMEKTYLPTPDASSKKSR